MTAKAYGYLVGLCLSVIMIFLLLQQDVDTWHSSGPLNPGHEKLACNECHISSDGTIRQQLQANVQYLLEDRKTESDFVYTKIGNKQCVACHDREDDHHPSYRFNEPKFKEARELIHPELCISCHQEHLAKRVSQFKPTDCQICHKEMHIEEDSITVPHHELIERKDWDTCLGCHDFHGNHDMKIEKTVGRHIKFNRILDYFNTGSSPYSGDIINKAKESIYEK